MYLQKGVRDREITKEAQRKVNALFWFAWAIEEISLMLMAIQRYFSPKLETRSTGEQIRNMHPSRIWILVHFCYVLPGNDASYIC
jgi:hypothetical protein